MTPHPNDLEPFDPADNPADSTEAFEDDDRDDDVEPAPTLPHGGGVDG